MEKVVLTKNQLTNEVSAVTKQKNELQRAFRLVLAALGKQAVIVGYFVDLQ